MQFFAEEETLLGSLVSSLQPKKTETQKNWGVFAILFIAGLILIIISIPFASFLILNPKPFCLLFSVGSLVILISMLQIIELKTLFNKISSSAATLIYLISLIACLYTGMFYMGYFYTLGLLSLQISTLIYLTVSLFPGGKSGMHAAFKLIKNQIKGIFLKKTFLPL
ncbi:unnamed protein product [Paramecium pentaurelia]|uniref:Vesicle transport protein n=1 Tax=Paramecium pentaurelia TaxID=43138 RepID=A0A8S1TNW1_9CILI|nr:unnamed protein product [Paramecium pentaurelia]